MIGVKNVESFGKNFILNKLKISFSIFLPNLFHLCSTLSYGPVFLRVKQNTCFLTTVAFKNAPLHQLTHLKMLRF